MSRRAPCGVCCCILLCVSWTEHWRLERMFVLMTLVRFEWYIFEVLMGIRLLTWREKGMCVVMSEVQAQKSGYSAWYLPQGYLLRAALFAFVAELAGLAERGGCWVGEIRKEKLHRQ